MKIILRNFFILLLLFLTACNIETGENDTVSLVADSHSESVNNVIVNVDKYMSVDKEVPLDVHITNENGQKVDVGEVKILLGMKMGHKDEIEIIPNEENLYSTTFQFDMPGEWFIIVYFTDEQDNLIETGKFNLIVS